ncbi:hypothetical protein EDB83DRAFT_2227614, partial [Lactarius deliciosus]
GKSTIVKQMKIIHQNGYTPEELLAFRPLIWKNLHESAHSVVKALTEFNLEPITPTNRVHHCLFFSCVLAIDDPDFYFSPYIAQAVQDLWADKIIPALMNYSSEFYLMDSTTRGVRAVVPRPDAGGGGGSTKIP